MSDSSHEQRKLLGVLLSILMGCSVAAQVLGVVYLVTDRSDSMSELMCITWLGIGILLTAYHTLLTYAFVRRPEREEKYSIWDSSATGTHSTGVMIFFLPFMAWYVLTLPITVSRIREDSRRDG